MHNKTRLLLLGLLLAVALPAMIYAQTQRGGGYVLPSTFNVVMQINDARAAYQLDPNYVLCNPWPKSLLNYPPYSFAAGKNFTLIIREIRQPPVYPPQFQDLRISATANATGFVSFPISVPGGLDVTQPSDWYVAIVVEWPRPGYYFLIYNKTFTSTPLIDVLGNLTGRPDLTGQEVYDGPWGVIKVYNGQGHYGNFSASTIHTFYIGVNTLGKQFPLTLTRIVTIGGATITLDNNVGPAVGPTNYVRNIDPNVQAVFGPFTYLGSYVYNLGSAGTTPDQYSVKVDQSQVSYGYYIYLTIEGNTGVVIQSKNSIQYAYNLLRYVSMTLNKTAGPGTGTPVPMSCNLVIWNMTTYTVKITGLLDLKGNPVFNPESFRFKIQTKIGDNWVTLDRAQGSWRLDIGDVKAALNQVCGTITSFNDLKQCYYRLGPDGFRTAVLSLYQPIILTRLGGMLKLTDTTAALSTQDFVTKLVAEYVYNSGNDVVNALVFEAPLMAPVNWQGVLNVSILPVQIRLWRWSNLSLPPALPNPREYYYSDPLDLASLRFVVSGDTVYIDRYAYDGAITYDPWLGQVIWSLPPYVPAPGLVGNVRVSLLAWFNASGYLPAPTLIANLTTSGFRYFNYSDAMAYSGYFSKFNIGIVGSYSYKFRIYYNDALVGTANIIVRYPNVTYTGLMKQDAASVRGVLQPVYDSNNRVDMYNVEYATPARFYDREHVIHIAIIRIFQNILLRDACGNPISGVSAGLAGAYLTLNVTVGDRSVTISRLPLGSEVPVDVYIPIDQWGNPQLDLTSGSIVAYPVLYYFGYKLYPVANVSQIPASQPMPLTIPIKFGVVRKPVLYLPIAPLLFRVWSQAISANYDPLKEPLVGFVVRVFSTATGDEMARSISNVTGYAYVPNVPIGVPLKVSVRTIVPSSDRYWSYTYEQIKRSNDYASYATFMGRNPAEDVYTLGTRGAIDAGLEVNKTTIVLTAGNASKYICAKEPINLATQVFDLVVRLWDKTGKYLLRSQYVYFGPYPQATRPYLMNVTLVVDGGVYPDASRWMNYATNDYKILTDFRVIGITGMRSIYQKLASYYLKQAQTYLNCPTYAVANYSAAINAFALAAMAGYIANASTDRYAAVFLLTSQQPKDLIDVCSMTPSQVGASELARLFMPGQRLRFVVWYLGQKVFDDYVTITGPVVDIRTDVYPVNTTTYTKSMRLPVDSFVGFTLSDVYVGVAANKTPVDTLFANASVASRLLAPFDSMYKVYNLGWLVDNELAKSSQSMYNDMVYAASGGQSQTWYYGTYKPTTSGVEFVYLPNLVVIRNGTSAKYLTTLLNSVQQRTVTQRSANSIPLQNFTVQVPASSSGTVTLSGAYIKYDPASNSTYLHLTAYNGTENGVWVQPDAVLNLQLAVLPNGTVKKNFVYEYPANYTIDLYVYAKCGNITLQGAPGDISVNVNVQAGKCPATIVLKGVNMSYPIKTIVLPATPSAEYVVSFDRWFKALYDTVFMSYGVLYHSSDVVERNHILYVLTYPGANRICAVQTAVTQVGPDDEYTYVLRLRDANVTNYRTLLVTLPWKIAGGGKALVNITAYFDNNNTLIDYKVYNLTSILNGTKGSQATVALPLNFGKVGQLAYAIATTGAVIRYEIKFYMYDPRSAPYSVCAVKLVPLYANYKTVSMYDCEVPSLAGPTRIDPTTVVYSIDPAGSANNGFTATFDQYGGFGAPITYVVRAGDVALLPSWYHKTSVAGSRISRIWLIAASDDPSKGPALGTQYVELTAKDDKVTVKGYKLPKYLVINYIPPVCRGYITTTYLDEFDGSGRISGLGFGVGGTSSLLLSNYTHVAMWNSTAMWMAGGVFKLPTVALDYLSVQNDAQFPIYVGSLTVKYGDWRYEVPMNLTRVDAKSTVSMIPLNGYGFGRTYMINATDVWGFRLVQPNYAYGLKVYHGGLVDAIKYFGIPTMPQTLDKYIQPLTSQYYLQNVLYASHAETTQWTFGILNNKISEVTRGAWGNFDVNTTNWDYKYVFNFPTLPLKEIRDWNDRPLANQTVALFDRSGRLYAVVYSNSLGRLAYPLPDLSSVGLSNVVRVAWYDGYIVELLMGKPEFTIWVYDQLIQRDVTELGNASANDKIRTYVYPLTVTVKDDVGRPLTNMYVKVVDTSTVGQLVNAANKTGADGGAQVVDLRISKYSTGVLSQIPPTSYYYFVYDQSGALVAAGRFEIQRGASVPSTGWNVVATVRYATEIPVKNSATRGYLLIKGVEFLNGTKKDIKIPFTISGGVMVLGGKVPVSVEYPVEIYVTHVTLGGQEVPVKGGQFLVFSGKTTDLLAGLDFAELGLTGVVTIQAVDASGAPRSDWTVQVLYGNLTAAQGAGQVQVVLPRTDVLDQPYVVRVITNAIAPNGKALVKEQTLELKQKALSLQIPVSTVKVVVQVIDGFGNVRSDWPVVVENVATGMGQVATELVDGQQYVARATGLGYTNTTTFVAKGPQMVVRIKIPTAKIVAQVVDGFGNVRSDWTVQVVGVTSGQGSIGPVEVLAGTYTVKTSVFGKEFSQTVNVQPGQTVTAAVQVPTAKLSVTAVDDDKKPLDRYVSSVELTGPLSLMFSTPPKDVEVLAGTYSIKVQALGKEASAQITLNPGEVKNIQVVVPGTAGLDIGGTRIPLPTLVLYGLLLLVVVVILAILIIEYNNWRRRRLMQILAPPK